MRQIAGITSVVSMTMLILLQPAAPAAPRKCAPFKAQMASSQSGQHAEAADAEVLAITDEATEKDPVTVEYEHGVGLDLGEGYDVLIPDAVFFNVQIDSRKRAPLLNLRTEWAVYPPQDVELYLYDEFGYQVAGSATFNPFPPLNNDDDGEGYEQIVGIPARKCRGFTIESQGGITFSVQARLKVWLE